mmetsp:Transcript_21347/g.66203  ORF Transcript_21347/g.66203 Transcript_21347/m.66203 type:complete len:586 (+) Transcript_21347:292-2049(+)
MVVKRDGRLVRELDQRQQHGEGDADDREHHLHHDGACVALRIPEPLREERLVLAEGGRLRVRDFVGEHELARLCDRDGCHLALVRIVAATFGNDLILVVVVPDLQEHFLERRHADSMPTDLHGATVILQMRQQPREGRHGIHGQPQRELAGTIRQDLQVRDVVAHRVDDRAVLRRARGRHGERVADAQAVLQEQRRPGALHATLRHDPDRVTQKVGLVHEVRRQHDGAPLRHELDQLPRVPPRRHVHPGRGLVEEHHAAAADERDADGELALLPARELERELLGLVREVDRGEHRVDGLFPNRRVRALEAREESQVLAASHLVPQNVVLRAVPDLFAHRGEVVAHRVAVEADVALIHLEHARHAVHRRRLARAVVPEQREHLVLVHVEAQVVHRHHPLPRRQLELFAHTAQLHRRLAARSGWFKRTVRIAAVVHLLVVVTLLLAALPRAERVDKAEARVGAGAPLGRDDGVEVQREQHVDDDVHREHDESDGNGIATDAFVDVAPRGAAADFLLHQLAHTLRERGRAEQRQQHEGPRVSTGKHERWNGSHEEDHRRHERGDAALAQHRAHQPRKADVAHPEEEVQ